jgi:phospholipase/lecithinase/hemolysin
MHMFWEGIIMNLYSVLRIAACATCIAGASAASTVNEKFTSFWVLGDSLSGFVGEPGGANTFRLSNGPLWSEQIINDFRHAGQQAESFAVPGATAGLERPNPAIPGAPFDLTSQVDRLLQETSRFGSAPIVSLWIGGNDVAAFQTGLQPADTISKYSDALSRLAGAGVRDLLLFEIPDVGLTPLAQSPASGIDPAAATQAASALNTVFFDLVVANLPSSIDVKRIDTFSLTQTALTNPAFFGAAAAGPCTANGQFLADCAQTTFFDPFHPTALVHDFVADQVRAAGVAPVPLPAAGWMLLSALAGMLVVKRRRARLVAA